MADGADEKVPEKKKRALPTSTTKFCAGVDVELIEMVRARPVLYDASHARFMDIGLKNAIWNKIGKQLKVNPSACKRRWYNIRDNYRKTLRRRSQGAAVYKFASILDFIDPYLKDLTEEPKASTTKMDNSEESNDSAVLNSILEEAEGVPQKSEANDADESDEDPLFNQPGSVVDYDVLDQSENLSESLRPAKIPRVKRESSFATVSCTFPSTNVSAFPSANVSGSYPTQSNVVDAFLAAIGPSLKALNPYHLSLAKAEIFATVHKYELKGIVENGWAPPGVNP